MGFLLDFHDSSMIFQWDYHDIPWYFYDLSIGLLWDSYGISMKFL